MKIHYTQKALDDLTRLRDFISRENPCAANKIAHRLVSAIDNLQLFPMQGRQISRRKQHIDEIRELIIDKYIVRYLLLKFEIQILRLWHGKEDWG